jgi:hypothetical protein
VPERVLGGYKAELDGQERAVAELEDRSIARWWSRRFSRSGRARALTECEPQELPADGVRRTSTVHELAVGDEVLSEPRAV